MRFFIFSLELLVAITLGAASQPASWPVFRGDASLSGNSGSLLASKPSLLWKFKTGAPVKSSAIIAGGKVFFGSNDTNVYALDLQTGKKLWGYKTTGSVEAPGLFSDGKLFIGSTDGFLYALEAKSGKLLWKYKTDGKILGAPNLVVASSRESAAESISKKSAA
ncbi:MAG: PQQ-binding-like beta-propeller repeat protein, partial [Verrucomicrobiota bacterium]